MAAEKLVRCREECPECLSSFPYTSFPPVLLNAVFKRLVLLLPTWEVLCSYLGLFCGVTYCSQEKWRNAAPVIKHGSFLNSDFHNDLCVSH
jgi:hypothetical protein